VDPRVATLGPPDGWEELRGLRGDIDPDALAAICSLPPRFNYSRFTQALIAQSATGSMSRARLFHHRDAAMIAGLICHLDRNRYGLAPGADEYCVMGEAEKRQMLGRLTLRSDAVQHVAGQLFGEGVPASPVTRIQAGRRALLLTSVGVRLLEDLSARAVAWGLLKWLVRTEVAQELQVTVDLSTLRVTEQLVTNATTGRMVNLIHRWSASRDDVREAVRSVGQRGPNFMLAPIPALLTAGLERGIKLDAMRQAIIEWWRDEPTRVHLVEISQAVSLFGVPRVQRRDIRELALGSYLRVGSQIFSHAYFLEGAEGG
jgi:hypothetical protein